MPRQKITKEMVVDAAFSLARAGGMEQVMVKNIAEKLGCSVQPIYSYCQNMDSLRDDVAKRAKQFVKNYLAEHADKNNPFQSTGQAHIRLAKEEPHILRIFTFQERKNISSLEEFYQSEASPQVAQCIAEMLEISPQKARQLHLDMLIYTIGISTIFSITTPGIPPAEIYSQQERAYQLFLKAAQKETI